MSSRAPHRNLLDASERDAVHLIRDFFASAHAEFPESKVQVIAIKNEPQFPRALLKSLFVDYKPFVESVGCFKMSGDDSQPDFEVHLFLVGDSKTDKKASARFKKGAAIGGTWLVETSCVPPDFTSLGSWCVLFWFRVQGEEFCFDGYNFWTWNAFGGSLALLSEIERRPPCAIAQACSGPSSDFRSWNNGEYTFSTMQAKCIKALFEAGHNPLGEQTILENAESMSSRLRDVFDKGKHPAWGSLIVQVRKGMFRLKLET